MLPVFSFIINANTVKNVITQYQGICPFFCFRQVVIKHSFILRVKKYFIIHLPCIYVFVLQEIQAILYNTLLFNGIQSQLSFFFFSSILHLSC
jgi:hypothetical protein